MPIIQPQYIYVIILTTSYISSQCLYMVVAAFPPENLTVALSCPVWILPFSPNLERHTMSILPMLTVICCTRETIHNERKANQTHLVTRAITSAGMNFKMALKLHNCCKLRQDKRLYVYVHQLKSVVIIETTQLNFYGGSHAKTTTKQNNAFFVITTHGHRRDHKMLMSYILWHLASPRKEKQTNKQTNHVYSIHFFGGYQSS